MRTNCARPDGTVCNSPNFCDRKAQCPFRAEPSAFSVHDLRVLVDVDGVVADLMPVWLNRYNRDFGDAVACGDVIGWDLREFVKADAVEAIYEYLDDDSLYDTVLPIAASLSGVRELRAAGHRVTFVTTAMNGHAGAKLRWLQRHGFLPDGKKVDSDYIECSDKSLIRGDVLVDDRHSTVRDYPGRTIMFKAPHNQDEMTPDMYATDWADVVNHIRRLAAGTDAEWSNRPDYHETIARRNAHFVTGKRYVEMTTPRPIEVTEAQRERIRLHDLPPDRHCVTRPDGACVAEGPCMHSTPLAAKFDAKDALKAAEKARDDLKLKADAAAKGVSGAEMDSKPSNPKDIIGSNKLPLTLFPATAIAMGSVGMLNGLCKYGRDNFRAIGIRASVYLDAADRHLKAWGEGQECDPKDGVHHLAAVEACIAIIIDARAAGKMHDDRKVRGGYHELVAELEPHVARLRALYADENPRHYTIADNTTIPDATGDGE